MINELDLLWFPNFIALGTYFIFETNFSWNEGIDTCFNVECVLLGRNFDFLPGYLVVTACYQVVTARYLVVTDSYCSFLVVTARYRSLLFVSTFSKNARWLLLTCTPQSFAEYKSKPNKETTPHKLTVIVAKHSFLDVWLSSEFTLMWLKKVLFLSILTRNISFSLKVH